MSAVFICHNTNSRCFVPLSIFVSVEKNSRSITVVKISVVYLALQNHLRLLGHFNENVSVFFVHYWKSSSLSENSLRRSKSFSSIRLSVCFRTWAVGDHSSLAHEISINFQHRHRYRSSSELRTFVFQNSITVTRQVNPFQRFPDKHPSCVYPKHKFHAITDTRERHTTI